MHSVRATIPMVMALAVAAQAQVAAAPDAPPSGWEFMGLPALNFNTDEGFGYGALLEAYNYGGGVRPYRFSIQPQVLLTTKGKREITVFFDAPGLLPNGWRLDAFAGREQELATPYYGLGNDAVEDTTLSRDPNPYYYRYGRTRLRLLANLQRRLGSSRARLLVGAGYADVDTDPTPFDSGTTLLAQQLAGGASPSGAIAHVRAGLVWDTRDREIGPRSGWWNELLVQRVDEALGASHSYTRVTATARRYVPITERLGGASRVILQQASGDVPLYDLASVQTSYKQEEGLGGSKMLRGIPKNRVMGKGMFVLNNELRWRATDFGLLGKPAFLTLSGFVDAGRVWEESVRLDEIASDLWSGYGGGVRLGFGASSVVALDVGKSSSATQIYIGLGYAF
jgi:outer membrane protein assembly factor BamA